MDRYPKDVPAAKRLVWNKSSPHSDEKQETHLGGLAIGGLKISDNRNLKHTLIR